jgi:hypothetical protein
MMAVSTPKLAASTKNPRPIINYHLHRQDAIGSIFAGSSILSTDGLCPLFKACPNQNIFSSFLESSFILRATLIFVPSLLMS